MIRSSWTIPLSSDPWTSSPSSFLGPYEAYKTHCCPQSARLTTMLDSSLVATVEWRKSTTVQASITGFSAAKNPLQQTTMVQLAKSHCLIPCTRPLRFPTARFARICLRLHAPDSAADALRVVKRAGQIQNGTTQCGDFSIAWLVAFAFGDDLETMSRSSFDQQQMRTHIRLCLAANRFERFPVLSRDRPAVFSREQVIEVWAGTQIFCYA